MGRDNRPRNVARGLSPANTFLQTPERSAGACPPRTLFYKTIDISYQIRYNTQKRFTSGFSRRTSHANHRCDA